MKYTKIDETTLEVETPQAVVKNQFNLDDLLRIRASIDVSEAEYLAQSQAEKDKFDLLISEARRIGIKTEEEIIQQSQMIVDEV